MRSPELTAAAAVLALAAAAARGTPFDPARVPADVRYVVHLDMDAARPTQLWKAVDDRLSGNEQFGGKVGQFEMASGMHFPRDLHDVTIYGRAAGDDAAVILIRGKMDRDQLMTALTFATNYSSEQFGRYDLASWDDAGRPMFGAYHGTDTFVLGRSSDNVKAALDTLDAKAPALAADAPLAPASTATTRPAGGPPLAYVAALDPASLAKPGEAPNPLLKQVDAVSAVLTEQQPPPAGGPTTAPAAARAAVRVSVRAKSPEAAQKLQGAANGLRAMVGLAAMSDTAEPKVKFAAAVLRTMTVAQDGSTVSADVSVGLDQLEQVADRAAKAKKDDN